MRFLAPFSAIKGQDRTDLSRQVDGPDGLVQVELAIDRGIHQQGERTSSRSFGSCDPDTTIGTGGVRGPLAIQDTRLKIIAIEYGVAVRLAEGSKNGQSVGVACRDIPQGYPRRIQILGASQGIVRRPEVRFHLDVCIQQHGNLIAAKRTVFATDFDFVFTRICSRDVGQYHGG